MNRHSRQDIQPGMQVTTTEPVEAYYSLYAGNLEQFFRPGMMGVVAAVNVPKVRGRGTFVCVDFTGDNARKWRAAMNYSQLVLKDGRRN